MTQDEKLKEIIEIVENTNKALDMIPEQIEEDSVKLVCYAKFMIVAYDDISRILTGRGVNVK